MFDDALKGGVPCSLLHAWIFNISSLDGVHAASAGGDPLPGKTRKRKRSSDKDQSELRSLIACMLNLHWLANIYV